MGMRSPSTSSFKFHKEWMEKYLQVGVCKVGAGESEGELSKWSKPGVRAVATQHGASAAYAHLNKVFREERKKILSVPLLAASHSYAEFFLPSILDCLERPEF